MPDTDPPPRPSLAAVLLACTRDIELALGIAFDPAMLADLEAVGTLREHLQSARARLVRQARTETPIRIAGRAIVAHAAGHAEGGRYEELPAHTATLPSSEQAEQAEDGVPPTKRCPV